MNRIARLAVLPLLIFLVAACSPAGPTTPAEGSAEREAIFDALRQARSQPDTVFVTRHFLVDGNWAYLTADPQSKDGSQKYETESWLLEKKADGWHIAAQPASRKAANRPTKSPRCAPLTRKRPPASSRNRKSPAQRPGFSYQLRVRGLRGPRA
jgi:hypothetical protein